MPNVGGEVFNQLLLQLLWIRCQEIFGSKNHFWLVKPYSKPHASTENQLGPLLQQGEGYSFQIKSPIL